MKKTLQRTDCGEIHYTVNLLHGASIVFQFLVALSMGRAAKVKKVVKIFLKKAYFPLQKRGYWIIFFCERPAIS